MTCIGLEYFFTVLIHPRKTIYEIGDGPDDRLSKMHTECVDQKSYGEDTRNVHAAGSYEVRKSASSVIEF